MFFALGSIVPFSCRWHHLPPLEGSVLVLSRTEIVHRVGIVVQLLQVFLWQREVSPAVYQVGKGAFQESHELFCLCLLRCLHSRLKVYEIRCESLELNQVVAFSC